MVPVDLTRPLEKGMIGRLAHSITRKLNSLGSMIRKFVLSNLSSRVCLLFHFASVQLKVKCFIC